ncbi:MAG: DUF2085 domain-containing protein [Anaerolineae bacterium]|nr:DUF2085 domain-containing protein [Anaerolineae bacterium]
MITVTVYSYPERDESLAVMAKLVDIQRDIPMKVITVNLDDDTGMAEYFGSQAPVVQMGPYRLKSPISEKELRIAAGAASDRAASLAGDAGYQAQLKRGRTITRSDRFNYWFSKNYPVVFIVVLAAYFGLAFLAPVLMKAGMEAPAKIIYVVYKPFCHQLAFRSFFLYGQQAFYPRELANIERKITYEELFSYIETPDDLLDARNFLGNEFTGYKIAICERCLAIYGSMLLFAIIFWASKNKIKSIPWYLWILLGFGPIGLDGVSQIPSLLGISLPEWMIMRESTPFFRVLTGTLFGLTTFWYLLPQIELSMRESRVMLSKKFAYVEQVQMDNEA